MLDSAHYSRVAGVFTAALAVVFLAGCSLVNVPPTPTARPTATPSLPPAVSGTLGPPPTDCATVDPPHTLTTTDFGGGFSGTVTFGGAAPAWTYPSLAGGVFPAFGTPYPGEKVMWVVGPNYNEPVTLSGRDLRTGVPLWFDIYPSNDYHGYAADVGYHTQAVLDPSGPNRGYETYDNDNWNIWGIGIIVSTASCYALDVTWAGGSWHTIFAAGTVQLPTVAP